MTITNKNLRYYAETRAALPDQTIEPATQPAQSSPYGGGSYLEPYSGYSPQSSVSPYSQYPSLTPQQAPGTGSGGGGGGLSGLLGNFKLQDIKSMIERMGGIEGVMANLGKVQKFIQTAQQVAPMAKLLFGSFLGGKAAAAAERAAPRRRRRRRGGRRKSSGTAYRTRRRRR